MRLMRIKTLDIYGYGRWINQKFDINDDIQLFYGRNESGKSTLQSFIRSILFGFPSRRKKVNQPNRYEPKNSDVYGGRILLTETIYGDVWIERTDKELKLYTDSGEELAISKLNEILGGLDESLFDNFYAFNLANLQELANVGADQLNDYFLSIGTLGSDKFLSISKDLEKQTDELFKPRGVKPELNRLLNDYDLLSEQANEAKRNTGRYNDLTRRRDQIDVVIKETNQQLNQVEQDIREKDKLISRYDTYLKLKATEKALQGLVFTTIPENAPKKLKDNVDSIQNLEEENTALTERISHIQNDLGQLTRFNWANNHEQDRKKWLSHTEQIKEVQTKFEQMNQRIHETNESMTQLAVKGQFYPEKIENSQAYEEKVEKGLIIQTKLIDSNSEIETIRIQRKMLLEQRKNLQNKSANLRQSVAKIENQRVNEEEILIQNTRLSEYFIGLTLLVVGLIVVFFNLVNEASMANIIFWLGVFMTIIGIASMSYVFIKHRNLMNEFNNSPVLDRANQLKEEEKQVSEQSRDLGTEINEKEDTINELEEAKAEIVKDQNHWLTEIGFYPTADPEWILKTNPVKSYFSEMEKRETYEAELAKLASQIEDWKDAISPLLERFPAKDVTTRVLIRHVEEVEASLIQAQQRGNSLKERLVEARERIEKNKGKIDARQVEIQDIYNKTDVTNRLEFEQRVSINQEIEDLTNKKELYKEQITGYEDDLASIESKQSLNESFHESEREHSILKGKLDPNIRERANLVVEIQQLEQDGTFQELSQQLENKKTEILEVIHEWGTKRLAMDMINQTLRKGLDNPVNEMNDIADRIFNILSFSRYTQIKMNKKDIKVKQFSDVLFSPHELSQGTLEQLYVALRLAFVISAQRMIKMPIIIDDAFVNFDEFRKTSMYKVLQDISEDIQVLFFTFDQQANETFHPKFIINLEEINSIDLPNENTQDYKEALDESLEAAKEEVSE